MHNTLPHRVVSVHAYGADHTATVLKHCHFYSMSTVPSGSRSSPSKSAALSWKIFLTTRAYHLIPKHILFLRIRLSHVEFSRPNMETTRWWPVGNPTQCHSQPKTFGGEICGVEKHYFV